MKIRSLCCVSRLMTLVVTGFITWVSLTEPSHFSGMKGWQWLLHLQQMMGVGIDKVIHFALYFSLAFFIWLALPQGVKRNLNRSLIVFSLASLWGAGMEILQLLGTQQGWWHRNFDWNDIIANVLGAAVSTILLMIIKKLRYSHEASCQAYERLRDE
ncbi:MAG: VanZ family protein [Kiritimatiellia bacterium]